MKLFRHGPVGAERAGAVDAKGVKLPTTIDEMVSAAAALNDPAKGVAGFTSRGGRGRLFRMASRTS